MYKFTKAALQRGISLLEVMLSLSIIAIILVMATRYFFVASGSNNVNRLHRQISSVMAAAATWRNSHPDYSTMTVSTLVSGGELAQSSDISTASGTSTLSNPWGTAITVAGTAGGYTITTTTATDADCTKLAAGFSTNQTNCTGTAFTFQFPAYVSAP